MPLVFGFKKNKPNMEFKKLLNSLNFTSNKSTPTSRLGYDYDFSDVDFDKICQLIENKAVDPNTKNETSDSILDITAAFGNHERLEKLLSITKFTPQRLGMALIYASKYNNYNCVRTLLERGADVNWSFESYDALQTAAKFGAYDCLKILLEYGANVNNANKYNGATALMSAIDARNIDCVRLLLDKGADTEKEDNYGNTATKRIKAILSQSIQDQFANCLHALHSKNVIASLPNIRDCLDRSEDSTTITKALSVFYDSAYQDIIVDEKSITCMITCEDLKKDDYVEMSLIKIKRDTKTDSKPVYDYMIQVCSPGTITKSLEHNIDQSTIPGAMIPGSETVAFQTGKLGDLIIECASLCKTDNVMRIMQEQNAHNSKKLAM